MNTLLQVAITGINIAATILIWKAVFDLRSLRRCYHRETKPVSTNPDLGTCYVVAVTYEEATRHINWLKRHDTRGRYQPVALVNWHMIAGIAPPSRIVVTESARRQLNAQMSFAHMNDALSACLGRLVEVTDSPYDHVEIA